VAVEEAADFRREQQPTHGDRHVHTQVPCALILNRWAAVGAFEMCRQTDRGGGSSPREIPERLRMSRKPAPL
jgi:hypothetical protein